MDVLISVSNALSAPLAAALEIPVVTALVQANVVPGVELAGI